MTTLPTTCITNLNQKLKKPESKNLTQLDAHGSSDQCCHYIKMKLRFYHPRHPYTCARSGKTGIEVACFTRPGSGVQGFTSCSISPWSGADLAC